ncbi:MAG: inorganic diphosphatase [Candidatus Altiarchaeota archaeon]
MRVVVETPRWSLVKYRRVEGGFVKEFTSPLPTFFNYGFVEGTEGADGMPRDSIVLGSRLRQGASVEVKQAGVVKFVDDGREDDKLVTSSDGLVNPAERISIHLFFTTYMLFKTVYYLLREGRITRCRYGGFTPLPSVV